MNTTQRTTRSRISHVAVMMASIALVSAGQIGTLAAQETSGGETQGARPQGGLPNVLLIGDSISIGYTPAVMELLKAEANVQRVKGNCGDTRAGLKNLKERWLGDTKWDVIHFNWGLHDLCYRNPESREQGQRDKVKGTISVPPEQYEKNLETLVAQLKETGAVLIWASTTVVPENEAGRFVGDDVKYNAIAAKAMQKHGIAINDLHALSSSFGGMYSKPGNVHYDKEGSAKLAEQVAASIRRSLPRSAPAAQVPPPGAALRPSEK